MKINDQAVKEILVQEKYVKPEDWRAAEEFAATNKTSAVSWLLEKGLLTNDLLGQAVAEWFHLPYADLNSHPPPRDQVLKIPEEVARRYRVVRYEETPQRVVITTDNPTLKDQRRVLTKLFAGRAVELMYSLPDDVSAVLREYRQKLATRFARIIAEQKRVAPEIIDEILADAFGLGASDIHFEPQEKEVIVRFRIDGVLREAGRIPSEYYGNIVNRIKVQAHLRIDEHWAAQDGAIRYVRETATADLRVSIVPTLEGETIALRLLSHYVRDFTLSDLGVAADQQALLSAASRKPFGMIVVAGPTGSGKTTTLYAVLQTLNRPEVNITTIEDPVEYRLPGVNQIQVNSQTGLTFSKGLRSIVRQDPNIILVGEIRDQETAEIAVNAALTGHLLLSTFHANDAATAMVRLLHLGIEPFLLASTLELVVAQRLVRKVCEQCRHSWRASPEQVAAVAPALRAHFPTETTLFKGKGCPKCGGSGYGGRIGLFEFIVITPALQTLLLQNPSAQQILAVVDKTSGYRSMFADGLRHVKNGLTTLEELVRVAAPS
ncbi:MAG: type II/IV secretion system protein [Candidatus Magasanikbacteria bacterium]|nr:type II/IV secretion system protein [Candidatus Magasanikbacteria bacterium]